MKTLNLDENPVEEEISHIRNENNDNNDEIKDEKIPDNTLLSLKKKE